MQKLQDILELLKKVSQEGSEICVGCEHAHTCL